MRYFSKLLMVVLFLIGYIFNMYFLTVDVNNRSYQWVNKIGIVMLPLGAVMGYVYILDKNFIIRKSS